MKGLTTKIKIEKHTHKSKKEIRQKKSGMPIARIIQDKKIPDYIKNLYTKYSFNRNKNEIMSRTHIK